MEFADFYYSAELGSGATQLDDSEYIFQLQEAQSCEMSIFLHRKKYEFEILPQKHVIRD